MGKITRGGASGRYGAETHRSLKIGLVLMDDMSGFGFDRAIAGKSFSSPSADSDYRRAMSAFAARRPKDASLLPAPTLPFQVLRSMT